jgi:hypothetical protein
VRFQPALRGAFSTGLDRVSSADRRRPDRRGARRPGGRPRHRARPHPLRTTADRSTNTGKLRADRATQRQGPLLLPLEPDRVTDGKVTEIHRKLDLIIEYFDIKTTEDGRRSLHLPTRFDPVEEHQPFRIWHARTTVTRRQSLCTNGTQCATARDTRKDSLLGSPQSQR